MNTPTQTYAALPYAPTNELRVALQTEISRETLGRASRLAKSVGCREGTVRGVWYFTPSRGRKWRALFDAGFDGIRRQSGWVYRHAALRAALLLPMALKVAPALIHSHHTQDAN
jgi:hypothetical protein